MDVLKRFGARTPGETEELQALVAAAREERQALAAMLTQVTIGSATLTEVSRALRQFDEGQTGTPNRLAAPARSCRRRAPMLRRFGRNSTSSRPPRDD